MDDRSLLETIPELVKCSRCGDECYPVELEHTGQCSYCDDRDREERDAWVAFYVGALGNSDAVAHEMWADNALDQFRERFPYPAKT